MRIRHTSFLPLVLVIIPVACVALFAQAPPSYPPDRLDQSMARIALYPDPLLAQILTASTFPDQIPDAARWADQHHYLTGQALADAIQRDQLPWDPSVQALLPFPSVLGMMASDMRWTTDLGNAFLAQPQDVAMNSRNEVSENDKILERGAGAGRSIAVSQAVDPGARGSNVGSKR